MTEPVRLEPDWFRKSIVIDETMPPGEIKIIPVLERQPGETFLAWADRCLSRAVRIVNITEPPNA